jgi:predicted transcriptional regulator
MKQATTKELFYAFEASADIAYQSLMPLIRQLNTKGSASLTEREIKNILGAFKTLITTGRIAGETAEQHIAQYRQKAIEYAELAEDFRQSLASDSDCIALEVAYSLLTKKTRSNG